jgi:hypothetical protein
LEFLVTGEPGLGALAGELADRGVPAPAAGYELSAAAWPAELAWPDRRVGVVLAHRPDPGSDRDIDAERRDAAYRDAGWQVRTATEWNADELAALVRGDAHGTPHGTANDQGENER